MSRATYLKLPYLPRWLDEKLRRGHRKEVVAVAVAACSVILMHTLDVGPDDWLSRAWLASALWFLTISVLNRGARSRTFVDRFLPMIFSALVAIATFFWMMMAGPNPIQNIAVSTVAGAATGLATGPLGLYILGK